MSTSTELFNLLSFGLRKLDHNPNVRDEDIVLVRIDLLAVFRDGLLKEKNICNLSYQKDFEKTLPPAVVASWGHDLEPQRIEYEPCRRTAGRLREFFVGSTR